MEFVADGGAGGVGRVDEVGVVPLGLLEDVSLPGEIGQDTAKLADVEGDLFAFVSPSVHKGVGRVGGSVGVPRVGGDPDSEVFFGGGPAFADQDVGENETPGKRDEPLFHWSCPELIPKVDEGGLVFLRQHLVRPDGGVELLAFFLQVLGGGLRRAGMGKMPACRRRRRGGTRVPTPRTGESGALRAGYGGAGVSSSMGDRGWAGLKHGRARRINLKRKIEPRRDAEGRDIQ